MDGALGPAAAGARQFVYETTTDATSYATIAGAAIFCNAVQIPGRIENDFAVGIPTVVLVGEFVDHGLLPGTQERSTGCRRRLQHEDRATAAAFAASLYTPICTRSVKIAVGANHQLGIGSAGVSKQGTQHPPGATLCELERTTAVTTRAEGRYPVGSLSVATDSQAGGGILPIGTGIEGMQDGEGLSLSGGCGKDQKSTQNGRERLPPIHFADICAACL